MTNDVSREWKNRTTPWGAVQDALEVAPGIVRVCTAGHGGYHLERSRQSAVSAKFPHFKTFAGGPWYEEDQDWAVVCLTFPEFWPPEAIHQARRIAKYSAALEDDPDFTSRLHNWSPRRWDSVVVAMA